MSEALKLGGKYRLGRGKSVWTVVSLGKLGAWIMTGSVQRSISIADWPRLTEVSADDEIRRQSND